MSFLVQARQSQGSLGRAREAQIQQALQSVQVCAQSQRAHQSPAQLGALKALMS